MTPVAASEIHSTGRLRPLPLRPRPQRDDTVDSYIRRLAAPTTSSRATCAHTYASHLHTTAARASP